MTSIRYDELDGPTLDPGLWAPLDIGSGPRIEPEARVSVEGGVVTVDVPRFTNADSSDQMLDNTKHVYLSTRGFRLPADGVGRFSAELRAEQVGGSGDFRHGFAAFNVADATGGTHMAFDILSTGDRIFAEHEVLAAPGQEDPFTRVVEDPFFFARGAGRTDDGFRRCSIEINRSRGEAVWRIDGEVLHVAGGLTGLPEEVHVVFGLFTLLAVGEGEGSAHGQGARGSWRNFQYSL